MKRTHTTTRAVLAGTLGLIVLAVSATGQVRQRNSGQALDANPQVGSGGYNTVVGGDRGVNTQLNRSNRYVTGQVSGLARFRGQVRYSAADQLNLDVPTASSLGGFRRQSVGITDVLGGGAFQTQLYRESSRATLSPRDVRQGQTRSDLLRDRRSLLDTDAGERLYSASRDRYTLMTTRQGDLLATSIMGDLAEDRIPRAESAPAEREGRRRRDVLGLQVSQPGAGALFSVLRSRDRLELARELSAMPMFAREDDAERDVQRDPLTGQPVNAEDRIEQSRQRPYALLGDPNAEGRSADESDPFETSTTRYYLQQNQDVFLEVMARLAEARGEAEVQWTRTTVKRGKQEPRVEFTRGEGLTVRALAGEGKDLFNQNMKRAQSHLKAGRYYDAAGRYELAAVADERNPMARVGMALALTAADETISAAYHLEQAIALYPDIARVRFDLQEMLSKKAVGKIMDRFDERKDREYATRSQAGRLLVQTFFHENLGNDAVAKKLAAKLLENEKASEPAKAYATFVTTGKWPEKTLKESDDGKPEN